MGPTTLLTIFLLASLQILIVQCEECEEPVKKEALQNPLKMEFYAEKKTWLHLYAECGHVKALEDILAAKNLNETDWAPLDYRCRTPLMSAMASKKVAEDLENADEVIKFFIDRSNIDSQPTFISNCTEANERDLGQTALSIGFKNNRKLAESQLRYLEKKNMKLKDFVDANGESELHRTVKKAVDAEINTRDYNKSIEYIKFLLEEGADENAQDNAGKTPLFAAVEYRRFEHRGNKARDANYYLYKSKYAVVRLLLKKGAKVDQPNDQNQTAIFEAVRLSDNDLIEILIKEGKAKDHKDHCGRGALDYVPWKYSHGWVRETTLENFTKLEGKMNCTMPAAPWWWATNTGANLVHTQLSIISSIFLCSFALLFKSD